MTTRGCGTLGIRVNATKHGFVRTHNPLVRGSTPGRLPPFFQKNQGTTVCRGPFFVSTANGILPRGMRKWCRKTAACDFRGMRSTGLMQPNSRMLSAERMAAMSLDRLQQNLSRAFSKGSLRHISLGRMSLSSSRVGRETAEHSAIGLNKGLWAVAYLPLLT